VTRAISATQSNTRVPDIFSIAAFIALILPAKILSVGTEIFPLLDVLFVACCLAIRSTRCLVLLLLVTAMSWPAIPAIDNLFGTFSALECVVLVLMSRNLVHFRHWRILFDIPTALFWPSVILVLFFVVSLLKGQSFTESAVLMRYLFLMHLTAFSLRLTLKSAPELYKETEELFHSALVASAVVYFAVYFAQFIDSSNYDRLFVESGGVREGSRVAYQIHFYLSILSATCFYKLLKPFARTDHESLTGIFAVLILSLSGLVLTQSRMALIITLILFVIVIFTRPALRRWALIIGALAVMGLISFGIQWSAEGRLSILFSSDAFIENMGVRLLPGILAFSTMSQSDYISGLGLGYKFPVPWFESRDDGILATSTFIDHLWLNIFVQAGIIGVIAVMAIFCYIGWLVWRQRKHTPKRPTVLMAGFLLLLNIHGFANFVYMKELYVLVAILVTYLNEKPRHLPSFDRYSIAVAA
jgi:hypothetical protein